jgi:hypothetical protein
MDKLVEGVAQLVDLHLDPGCAAVALPAVVGRIVGQRPPDPLMLARNSGPAV